MIWSLVLLLCTAPGLSLDDGDKPILVWERHIEVGRTPSYLLFGPKSRDLYVSCAYDTAIVQLNGKTWETTERFRLSPISPLALLPAPGERHVVVANFAADDLHWLNPKTGAVDATLKLDFKPISMTIDTKGKRAAIACDRTQAVYFVDLGSRKVVGNPTIVTGQPQGMQFDTKGSSLYVACGDPKPGLTVIQTAGGSGHTDLPLATGSPLCFSRDEQQLFVVGSKERGRLLVLGTRKKNVEKSIDLASRPQDLLLLRSGRTLAVLSGSEGEILLLDTRQWTEQQRIKTGQFPTDMALSANGKLLAVANRSSGNVSLYRVDR